jgi:alpha-L-rhamnosidase
MIRTAALPAFFAVLQAVAAPIPPPIVEPFAPLHGGQFVPGHGALVNPDPLRDYVWNLTNLLGPNTSLQQFRVYPTAVTAFPTSAFTNEQSLVLNSTASSGTARAVGMDGTLRVDFAIELAAWLELRSPDLSPAAVAAGCITLSVGESSTPNYFAPNRLSPGVHNASNPLFAGWKTEVPTPYMGGVYRLELNVELFEGIRYGFLHVNASCGVALNFTIVSLTAVAQVKPANWAAFASPGRAVLERSW